MKLEELRNEQIRDLNGHLLRQSVKFHGDFASAFLLKLSSKYIKGKVIDFGAGTGALVSKIPGAIGIDLNGMPEANIIEMNITKTSFPDGSFQTVFCSEVLEHLPSESIIPALQEVYRVLSPNSYAIFTTPYKEDLSLSEVYCPFCQSNFHIYGHVRAVDKKYLVNHLSGVGFRIEKMIISPLSMFSQVNFFSRLFRQLVMKISKRWDNQRNLVVVAYKP